MKLVGFRWVMKKPGAITWINYDLVRLFNKALFSEKLKALESSE
ncbi:hypothetical protein [Dyadobacter alkalitolerans]|nr:hypothetical protein [Dyadobacter alkalitolerans]